MRRLALIVALLGAVAAAPLQAKDKDTGNGLQVPVAGATAANDTFAGTFTLQRFATDNDGKLVAVGTIAGTLTSATGQVIGTGLQTVAIPTQVNSTAGGATAAAVAQITASCAILHLDLGPLTLNLLGLQVNLSRVVLDITAVPGAGNLLGNLLCSIANLLNNPTGLAQLLNQILGILQGL
jgi:hypothetical protein